ncbi:unnamed protein product [Kuraishia capsulata CBS 1993]|uniref:AB hydrolase-1 domain-containing protein n=1 Tax=Kuraishia capsulata CBS 1993 TaxID=1382522 RepID=W6MT00_9ASCO|nr:uncharacterized protein KUCA_T00004329001 [Kuraishia capsulata CBS 1993]CDK28347.1 unnamed protein product [Kuraishia capsulata CBS 1993]
MPSWGFRNTVHAHYSNDTVKLASKDSEKSPVSLDELIKNNVPEFVNGARANFHPLLFNGTLQTMYLSKADYSKVYQVNYGRKIIEFPGEDADYPHLTSGQTTADYAILPLESREEFKAKCAETLPEGYPRLHPRTRYLTEDESKALDKDWASNDHDIVIINHGLAGGSHEPAIRGVVEKLFDHGKGMNVVVLNSRGCCRSKITTPELFSGFSTDDIRYFVDKIHKAYPTKLIYLMGFSFGGLLVANYLAEEAEKSVVTAAVTIGAPWDLLDSMYHLQHSWSGRKLFAPAITYFLTNLIKVNFEVLKQRPDIFGTEYKNPDIKSPPDFDDRYTAKYAGFVSASDYYRIVGPVNRMSQIQTPLVSINSLDDPTVSVNLPFKDAERNPYLYLMATDFGGHLAYLKPDGDLWIKDPVSKLFNAFGQQVAKKRPITEYKPPKSRYYYKIHK